MATKNIVPRATGEGELGTSSKKWSKVQAVTGSFDHIQTTTMASEIYTSGSTKFGDTSDDTHQFTGSVLVDGNISASAFYGKSVFHSTSDIAAHPIVFTKNTTDAGSASLNYDTALLFYPNTNELYFNGTNIKLNTSAGIKDSAGTKRLTMAAADGSTNFVGNVSASLNISASAFYGDGSNLTGIATGTPTLDEVTTAGNTTANNITVGQVSASYLSASSDARVAGNSHFGSELTNTHIFTGSFHQTGSGATSTFKDRIITTGSMAVHGLAGTSEVFRAEGTGDFHVQTDGNITFNSEGNDIEFLNGSPRIYLNLDVEGQVSGSSFVGDGSGLTGVTVDWDGQHTGDAGITGSLEVSQDITASNFVGALVGNADTATSATDADTVDTKHATDFTLDYVTTNGNTTTNSITASAFSGDGSGLTGVTGDWDGQHTGDAGITGSLDVSGSTTLGSLVTDTHIITGSTEVYVEAQTGLQVLQDVASSGYPVARFENTNAGGSTYVETHGTNQGGIKMYRGGVVRASIDTGGNAFCMYNGTPIPANLGFMIASGKAEFKETTADNFTGTKAKLNVSASSGPAIRIDSGATGNETTFKVEDYTTTMVSASADLLTMDDTSTPPTPTNAAHLYAITGSMYVQDTSGTETKISPHDEYGEWEYFSRNTKTGKVTRIRMEKMIRKLEELTGETFIEEE